MNCSLRLELTGCFTRPGVKRPPRLTIASSEAPFGGFGIGITCAALDVAPGRLSSSLIRSSKYFICVSRSWYWIWLSVSCLLVRRLPPMVLPPTPGTRVLKSALARERTEMTDALEERTLSSIRMRIFFLARFFSVYGYLSGRRCPIGD